MKKIKPFLVVAFTLLIGSAFAQDREGKVKVYGNCTLCGARIEQAARLEGVKEAQWDLTTKMLTVTYEGAKVTGDAIQKSIAAAGHDTEKFRADAAVYKKLPACCRYDRKPAEGKPSQRKAGDASGGQHP
jgi:copper chaperone CopZ